MNEEEFGKVYTQVLENSANILTTNFWNYNVDTRDPIELQYE